MGFVPFVKRALRKAGTQIRAILEERLVGISCVLKFLKSLVYFKNRQMTLSLALYHLIYLTYGKRVVDSEGKPLKLRIC